MLFLSTPSARRATADRGSCSYRDCISIHALCEEGDTVPYQDTNSQKISIHALCEEGDVSGSVMTSLSGRFLSTPSARRATCPSARRRRPPCDFYPRPLRGGRLVDCRIVDVLISISIHALCEEGDPASVGFAVFVSHFYPRPLRGGRLLIRVKVVRIIQFLSTPSARRATSGLMMMHRPTPISIHALCEEGDRCPP